MSVDRDFIKAGGCHSGDAQKLLNELELAEQALLLGGYHRCPGPAAWKPPVDPIATRYHQILPVFEALLRIYAHHYTPWTEAGGPNECPHGRAAGIPCPHCDADTVNAYVNQVNEQNRRVKGGNDEVPA